jgi:hypothetical protein
MRTGEAFILGTITGAVVVWLWGRELGAYALDSTRELRVKAAEGVRAVEETAASVVGRSGTSLRRAEEFLHGTKKRVGGALRAAQKAIRPPPSTGTV